MTNDVMLNKINIIERCTQRIKEVYDNDPANLEDFTKQDSMILNIQRACEAVIDIAMHIVAERQLGLPQTSQEAFDLLKDAGLVDQHIADQMKRMVGFKNIAVHNYQDINQQILERIITSHIGDFTLFTRQIIQHLNEHS